MDEFLLMHNRILASSCEFRLNYRKSIQIESFDRLLRAMQYVHLFISYAANRNRALSWEKFMVSRLFLLFRKNISSEEIVQTFCRSFLSKGN